MKILLSFIVAAFIGLASCPANALQQSIAATVNDSVITIGDVQDRARLYLSAGGQKVTEEQIQQATPKVLDKLIDETLQVQEAKKFGIEVNEQDLAAAFADIAKQNGTTAEEFKSRLSQSGANPNSLKNQLKADIAWSRLVRRKLRPQINVSENDIDFAFDQAENGSGKTSYRVAELFLAVADESREKDVREEAEKLAQQIRNGAPFSSMARQYSQAPGATQGGDLGWIRSGQLEDALDKALPDLRPGQITAPIRTKNGYTLLFMIDERVNSGANALLEEPAQPQNEGETVLLKQIFIPVDLKKSKEIVNAKGTEAKNLQKKVKNCAQMDAMMKKYASPQTGDRGKVALARLPPELRAVLAKIKIGALTDPILTPHGFAVMMVCARDDGKSQTKNAEAAPALDKGDEVFRDKVAVKLGSVRLDQMAIRYLSDLRATAFIDKRI